jgi:hypothetical protein
VHACNKYNIIGKPKVSAGKYQLDQTHSSTHPSSYTTLTAAAF